MGLLLKITVEPVRYRETPNAYADCWTESVRVLHCPTLLAIAWSCDSLQGNLPVLLPSNLCCLLSKACCRNNRGTWPFLPVPSFLPDNWRTQWAQSTYGEGPLQRQHVAEEKQREWDERVFDPQLFWLLTYTWLNIPFSFKEFVFHLHIHLTALTLCCFAGLGPNCHHAFQFNPFM